MHPLGRWTSTVLPVAAIATFIAVPGTVVLAAVANGTFGFDFLAYHQAAARVLAGQRLYDPSVQVTGGFGLFYYPPPFVLGIIPLALLPASAASWLWVVMSAAMLLGAIGLMPVRATVRWMTLLLAGLSWPVAYALKLGQVGPLLLLLFAIGWRWIDRPRVIGGVGAIGTIVKIQPGLILVWAMATRRWSAVVAGAALIAVAATAATLVAGGPSIWVDYIALLRNVSDPITTPHNFTPGAVAFQMGMPESVAAMIQIASSVAAVFIFALAAFRLRADASFLVAVIASQILSPVLWDHYAILLLLPTAWLLERNRPWAVAIVLATSVLVVPFGLPPAVYPIAFWLALAGLLERAVRGEPEAISAGSSASS